ncbi:MAG: site-specific DNA-methyltransferase [Balneolales bacterium]|nr:site-specific DNA-methyltransferase [Balneolales bacterium]
MTSNLKKLGPEDGQSKDLISENVEKLKQLFPEIVTDGKVDFDTLKEVLGEFTDDRAERYSFNWNGKSQARKLAMTPSKGTLRPVPEESVNWDSTENLFIEGDNLEVLKLLQRSYHKKVKMIYIDPPYNTGKDFVYKDNFKDNIRNYKEITGQLDSEGKNISSNPETSGRYHTDWLNMMYPRLKLARELLKEDGVIFISIDDNEVANLRKVSDEVFGEENFIAELIWERAYAPKNDARYISDSHDYILMYSKSINDFEIGRLPRTEEANARYKNPDNDPRGVWKASDMSVKTYNSESDYQITTPSGRVVEPPAGRCWSLSKKAFFERLHDNRIWFGPDGDSVPSIKRFLTELKFDGMAPTSILFYKEVGHSQEGSKEVVKLFEGKGHFDGPKPQRLLNRLITLSSLSEKDIVLDFFAGSASTAHSVLTYNLRENHNLKFIMVQLPERLTKETDSAKAGYETIAELARERIIRVLNQINKAESNSRANSGFKVFKLDTSNIKPWDPDFDQVQLSLEDTIENVKPDRTELDVLYEILLKYGLDIAMPIEEREVAGAKVYIGGAGAIILCLSANITLDVVEGITAIKKELQPELMRVVFRDGGFKNDVVKTNAVQILKQSGIEDVRSI